jgi:sugar lactone lactonase YvrE/DNA-directed RNA polymerase subunit RPC12/RpoP
MPAALRCPTCSAPLDLPPEHATMARCTYCGAAILLTERGGSVQAAAQQAQHTDAIAEVLRQLRAGSKIGAIAAYRERFGVGLAEAKHAVERIEAGQEDGALTPAPGSTLGGGRPAGSPRASSGGVLTILGCTGLVIFMVIRVVLLMRPEAEKPAVPAPQGGPVATAPRPPAADPTKPAGPPPFAQPVMRFGSEGTGAGRFDDARSVAVDGAGRIYVAEYSGGRVQVFDSAGTFVTQWMADTRMPLLDLAVDRGGTVYVVQSGRIRRYEGATGRALGEVPRSGGQSFDDVALALDGTLWAVSGMDEVVHLRADGRVLRTINTREAIDEDAMPMRVAVAGTGDVYVMDRWNGEVYHLGPDGRFRDRFGGRSKPGADGMSAPQDLAIDGRGRVFVSDMMGGIYVFDADGRPVGEFGDELNPFGITFNDRDDLFATNRNDHEVVRYKLAQ